MKTRSRLIANIQQQIDAGRQDTGPSMFRAWVTGDTAHLQMDSYPGFPDQSSHPQALAAGVGWVSGPVILGGAISYGELDSSFGAGRGSFKQDEFAGSLYAGFLPYPFWGTLIGTYGKLDYDVNRLVPIGITTQSNLGNTDGTNLSVASQFGFAFGGCTKAGPFAGLVWQRVEVDGFTESGGFTSLSFADQNSGFDRRHRGGQAHHPLRGDPPIRPDQLQSGVGLNRPGRDGVSHHHRRAQLSLRRLSRSASSGDRRLLAPTSS